MHLFKVTEYSRLELKNSKKDELAGDNNKIGYSC